MLARFLSADTIVPGSGALTLWPSDATAAPLFGQQNTPGLQNPQELNRYAYVNNNPVRHTDSTGHLIDTLLDVGFIAYGIYDIAANGYTAEKGLALAADVGSALIPGVTGGGMAVRALAHADDVAKAVTKADKAADAANVIAKTGCSFSADTPVATADGPEPIGEIEVGEQVLAYDEATGTTGSSTVTDVLVHADPVLIDLTIAGEAVETTPEHPFYTLERTWVEAGGLWVGAQVRRADGSYGVVQAVRVEQRAQAMYNLTVETAHTFFVGEQQWLVHNTCSPAKITGYTDHGLNQAIGRNGGRGTSAKAMLDAVNNPKKVVVQDGGTTRYVGKDATVVLNDQGKVVSTWGKPRGPQIRPEGTKRLAGSSPAQRKANIYGYSYNPKAIR